MTHSVWTYRWPFNISRAIWRIAALSLIVWPLLLVAPPRCELAVGKQQQQDEKALAALKLLSEGAELSLQETAEGKRDAIQKFEKALSLSREIGDQDGQAMALFCIGQVSQKLDEGQKALQFYEQALLLWRAIGERNGEALLLNNMGLVHATLDEWQKALDFYTQSLRLYRSSETTPPNNIFLFLAGLGGEAAVLTNIGTVYRALGEQQRALDSYLQALSLVRDLGDRDGEATILNNIGSIYDYLGEQQKALDFYTQTLPRLRAAGKRGSEATVLNNIGSIYADLGEQQKALDFYTQSLALQREIKDRVGEAVTLNNIAGIYDALGEQQKALSFCAQSLLLWRATNYRSGEATMLSNLASLERGLGRLNEARAHLEESLKLRESLRTKVVSPELRASFFAMAQNIYEFYIDLLIQLHRQEPDKNHHAAALQVTERARARSLLENLIEGRANVRQGVNLKLLAQERVVQRRLNAKAEELLKLGADVEAETRLAAAKKELDALTIELQQVQTQIRQVSPRYAALTQPQPLTLAEIQQQVIDGDTLLLEYALGKERSFLWAVTPTTINSYELPKREVIESTAQRVYQLMADSATERGQSAKPRDVRLKETSGQYLAAATSLSQMLLKPVARQLGKKRLVMVADGALHYIPFGALPDPAAGDPSTLDSLADRWKIVLPNARLISNFNNTAAQPAVSSVPLLLNHEVITLPSASTLAVLRRELKDRKPAAKTLAVLADPVFTRKDARFKASARPLVQQTEGKPAEPSLKDLANEKITRKLLQQSAGDLEISRLPFTQQEAERILALVPANERMQALGFAAKRALVESDQLSQYRYVHFATHGLADSERAELSSIVLSLVDEQGRPQDGFLRAHEVYNLNLPAELVVLSACETGLGKRVKGEGLVSLTRGFMYAGAARVVVSLWSVNDRATAELMTKFYRKMLVEGQRPAAALRAAQIEMWRTPQWSAPYYWAAFTLQGEWR
jgi:CHAT domain-containing protein